MAADIFEKLRYGLECKKNIVSDSGEQESVETSGLKEMGGASICMYGSCMGG